MGSTFGQGMGSGFNWTDWIGAGGSTGGGGGSSGGGSQGGSTTFPTRQPYLYPFGRSSISSLASILSKIAAPLSKDVAYPSDAPPRSERDFLFGLPRVASFQDPNDYYQSLYSYLDTYRDAYQKGGLPNKLKSPLRQFENPQMARRGLSNQAQLEGIAGLESKFLNPALTKYNVFPTAPAAPTYDFQSNPSRFVGRPNVNIV